MKVSRWPDNPIISPKDIKPSRDDFEVIGVFNSGVARLDDKVILLLRVAEKPLCDDSNAVAAAIYDIEKNDITLKKFLKSDKENDFSDPRLIQRPEGVYLTSISHLRLAKSSDGVNFQIEETPALSPANEYETFGIEDARISRIGDKFYITYVAVSPLGVVTSLASTRDFNTIKRMGIIFCPDNKDVMIFPEKIDNKFYALHRPASSLFKKNEIWIAESDDLLCWGNHKFLMAAQPNCFDETKIGAGAVPVKTEKGWLEIYHGADKKNRYSLGAVLFDKDQPDKIIARSKKPILEPQTDYECSGFFGNVIFTCGVLTEDDKLKIYYGAADTSICYAECPLGDVFESISI